LHTFASKIGFSQNINSNKFLKKETIMEGTVKWFNSTKGYGFITGEDGTDYFAHFGEINMEGFKKLEENQSVTFEVGDGEKGPVAKDISVNE
tara:strand:+ start:168 stop:443 length:276 start_codon:yes stop_codon:yes gene_type:complete